MCIYLFEHCACLYESSYALISAHKTPHGAYKAMKAHKWQCWQDERDLELRYGVDKSWGPSEYCQAELWRIRKIEIKE